MFQLNVTVDEIRVEPGSGLVISALAAAGTLFLQLATVKAVSYTHLTLPTIYSV